MNAWDLPVTIQVNGQIFAIRSDFRAVLSALAALNAPDMSLMERTAACLQILIPAWRQLPDYDAAFAAAMEFVNLGKNISDGTQARPALVDWEKDVALIAPAVDKVLGYSCRQCPYLHWWEFVGAYTNIGSGLLADVVNIRLKRATRKKLEPHELTFEREHPEFFRRESGMSSEERAYFKELGVL